MIQSKELQVAQLPVKRTGIEVAERKGLGHPDTICDALAEEFSKALCRYYMSEFGVILHHNVDKALLRGGRSDVHLGGGDMLDPIEIYLAGRATTHVGGRVVPVQSLALESAQHWLAEHIPELDSKEHLRIHCVVREGSADLKELFGRRRRRQAILSNDTSLGVGYAPLSPFELLVLDIERELNSPKFQSDNPQGGADVKVMGVCNHAGANITIARAFRSPLLHSVDDYLAAKQTVAEAVFHLAEERGLSPQVRVNVADDPSSGSLYLTLTGTSAEAGGGSLPPITAT